MQEISTFISQAREKGLDDETIRKSLEVKGWDKVSVNMALAGLEAPVPTAAKQTNVKTDASSPSAPAGSVSETHSLGHLMAALLHVVLWFFTASSAVTIGGAIASLYGMEVSANALASMLAVTVITFIPYAVLYAIFLRKNSTFSGIIPGKVWSIITICLHSVGAMVAAIVAVVTAITNGEQAVLVSAALIAVLDLLVIFTYAFAAFGFKTTKTRNLLLTLHLPLLIIMFGILFTLSLLNLGPAKHDEDLRRDLTSLVRDIAQKTRAEEKLPNSIEGLSSNRSITYKKLSDKKYQVCADFQTSSSRTVYYGSSSYSQSDDYVSESQFSVSSKGNRCFDFSSSYLEQKGENDNSETEIQYY